MGLELNEETIAQNMPEYALVKRQNAGDVSDVNVILNNMI